LNKISTRRFLLGPHRSGLENALCSFFKASVRANNLPNCALIPLPLKTADMIWVSELDEVFPIERSSGTRQAGVLDDANLYSDIGYIA
jgi:hypothetical protein